MALVDRVAEAAGSKRFNLGQYPAFVQDYYSQFGYAGGLYPLGLNQSMYGWQKTEEISATLPNYIQALRKSPPAFAAQMVRASVLSMARFTFRNRPGTATPRRTFGNQELRILEKPWTNATTGELISRMEWSAGLAGNAYVLRGLDSQTKQPMLRVLRPDWVAIVYGSQSEPDDPKGALDGRVIGYAYVNGGFSQNNPNAIQVLLPEQVAHWSPTPDPMSPGLGMSWITPALRDIQGDNAALEHKLSYFSNGATPNLVIKGIPGATPAQFQDWVDKFEGNHKGSVNAFKSLYLSGGADATVIGSNLAELDLTSITSHGETRVSYLSRVPAVILGIAAGLKGSSLNAGNYAEARRNLSDTWVYPTLQDLCASLSSIIPIPGGSELWFDVADIPLLREDAKDAAAIEQLKQATIVAYVNGGFTPESAVAAVQGQDISQLVHTGLVSVQLQLPGSQPPAPTAPEPAMSGANAERSLERVDPGVSPVSLTINNNVQPAEVQVPVTVEAAAVSVLQPDVINNVTVQPAAAPNVTIEGDQITVQPAEVQVPVTVNTPEVQVQPADITVLGDTINVQPAEVSVPVTVEAPDVTIPVTVQPAAVSVPITVEQPDVTVPVTVEAASITVQPPAVTVEAPVTVNLPAEKPSQGVDLVYDGDKVIGTRPRGKK